MKKTACFLLIALTAGILFFICIPFVQAEEYIVQPAYGLVQEPAEDTGKEVSFYELTPRAMIIFIALSFSPLLVYPVEFFLMLKLFAYLGYRKIDELMVFYNDNRRLIYEAIVGNPGMSFNALMLTTGVKQATLKHHLHILEQKKKIVRYGAYESSGYFENNGWSDLEKSIFVHLRNSTTRNILEIVSTSAEISRKDIARILGITGPSVTWHTNRLSQEGIIKIYRYGRDIRISISRETAAFIMANRRAHPKPVSVDCLRINQPA
jgi:predicted transcriptional regulator